MLRESLIERLLPVIQAGPPLRLAFLFGSVARASERPESDVDIAILPMEPSLSLRDELALQVRLALAAKREVDLMRLDHCTPALRFRVAREGVALLGDHVELSRFRARAAIEHAELEPQLRRARERFLKRLQASASYSRLR